MRFLSALAPIVTVAGVCLGTAVLSAPAGSQPTPVVPARNVRDSVARDRGLDSVGFYNRRRDAAKGLIYGLFFEQPDIGRQAPNRLSSLFFAGKGIWAAHTEAPDPLNYVLKGRRGCAVPVFLDGRLLNTEAERGKFAPVAVDEFVKPGDVSGVEIYDHETKALSREQLRWIGTQTSCGAVVIWTKADES